MSNWSQSRLKYRIKRDLDRRGGRAVLRLLMSVRIWQKHRVLVPVRWHPDGYWILRYPEAAIPQPSLFVDPLAPRRREEEACDVFFQEYTPGSRDIVVDIGAGPGSEVNLFSRLVGSEGHVYAIEPHPITFQWLARRCAASGLSNVTPVTVAISDRAGTVWLSDEADPLENRLVAGGSGHPVRALTLDDFMQEHEIECVDFLKMNIEGAERLAIRGMREGIPAISNMAIGCHDFLADRDDDEWYRTQEVVRRSLLDRGYQVVERRSDDRRDWARGWLYAFREPQGA
jgi:FkbM family methyltransferase